MATNGNLNYSNHFTTASETNASTGASTAALDQSSSSTAAGSQVDLSKDEIAWFFVEQYYTTLSKTPEKLHLFYGKRSQFVYGQEAEVASVSVGRQAIQERIKALEFGDQCKVRVSNVDSQSSNENIVIQVIGETSKKAGDDPKKFVQTFVLAQQPSGYFVLNDILRYIDEEGEEEPQEPADTDAPVELPANVQAEAEVEAEPAQPESVAEELQATTTLDPGVVNEKLEEVTAKAEDTASVNGDSAVETPAEPAVAAEDEAVKTESEPLPDPEKTAKELEEEDTKEPEKPADPSPTPVVSRQPPAPAAAAPAAAPAPAQPPKPMTWASRIAAAAGSRPAPALPLSKAATPPAAATQSRPAQAPSAPSQPAAAPAQATDASAASASSKESSEWQTAGSESKRNNRPGSISGPSAEKEGALGYVKYVTTKVQREELEAALAQHGELVYFDINRQKNCAFVEFASPAGYQAAFAANPHIINGESITIEPRRPKASAYGGANYAGRGGMPNRGARGGFDGGRPGNQAGRGGFEGGRSGNQPGRGGIGGPNRGRGGMPPRGRGASQAANA
ncbi:uncharacterized protein BCR38DRAFT_454803 [Pseudomassariella vexata]|uniref:NTF2 domain-containing protein n=1 Tax=Pseudomassariella vexata TaxID=1141098 RepID=A0A1Y2EEA1_9PEZI|nr:uncharacterized protein BCR38DRAFT_454803 [Pseudomassariella vexata]ORY69899.1 hypothetical protein BCR38DRAFT_454803 [Pseudomassariella vexata]